MALYKLFILHYTSFNKKYNIVILFSKWGQNCNQKLFDNQAPALTERVSEFFADSAISVKLTSSFFF